MRHNTIERKNLQISPERGYAIAAPMNLEIKNRFKSLISKDLMRILLYSTMCSENKDGRPCENDRTKKLLDVNICSYMFQKCKIFQHSNSSSIQQTLRTLYQILLLLILLTVPCSCAHSWESPGCHRVGKSTFIYIPTHTSNANVSGM